VQYMNKSKDRIKFCFYLIAIIVGCIGIFVYMKSNGILNYMSSAEEFKKYIKGYGDKAYVVFFIIQFISVIIEPLPSNISAVVGGTAFFN
jgi:uncharacterized membrane protein YdjX (TVP38/TMEM64 family)